jgi:putative FmdB family regulatory protein
MPTYEYACGDCGEFTALRPMAQRHEPQPCPECGAPAPRVLATAPAFAGLPAAARQAHALNERSAHEPKQSSRHGAGCSCCSGAGKSSAVRSPDGKKAFPGKRPWMISH